MYFRARHYDQHVGEFVSRDPLEFADGKSCYRGYHTGLKDIDPWGLDLQPPTGIPSDDVINAGWNQKFYRDAAGKYCCSEAAVDCNVGIAVQKPCRPVWKQVASNLAAGLPVMHGVVTGHAWLFGNCGNLLIDNGVWNVGQNPLLDKADVLLERKNTPTHYRIERVCPATFNCLWDYVDSIIRDMNSPDPPKYCFFDPISGGNLNCSTFARDGFQKCGLPVAYFGLQPFDLASGFEENKPCIPDSAGKP